MINIANNNSHSESVPLHGQPSSDHAWVPPHTDQNKPSVGKESFAAQHVDALLSRNLKSKPQVSEKPEKPEITKPKNTIFGEHDRVSIKKVAKELEKKQLAQV